MNGNLLHQSYTACLETTALNYNSVFPAGHRKLKSVVLDVVKISKRHSNASYRLDYTVIKIYNNNLPYVW